MKEVKLGGLDARLVGGSDGDGGGPGPVVVLLHGFGAPGDDLVPLWRGIEVRGSSRCRFVFPAAPIALPLFGAGRAWWWVDLDARMRRQQAGAPAWDTSEVPQGLLAARRLVTALLKDLRATMSDDEKIVLGGFSQGAMLSLDVALSSDEPLAGLVLMSGTHIAAGEWATFLAKGARRAMPVFMSHGTDDPLLPFTTAERLRDVLLSHELRVEWHAFRGEHGIPPEVMRALGPFLSHALA
jgi:phospholipase/carboxylesterase